MLKRMDTNIKNKIKELYLKDNLGSDRISNIVGFSSKGIRKFLKREGLLRSYDEAMNIFSKNSSNYTNTNFFENIDTEEKAYWLGFIYADGNINKHGTLLTIGLKDKDENHLLKFSNIFGKDLEKRKLKKYKNIKSDRIVVYCRIGNKYLCDTLVSKGIEPRKTYKDSIEVLNCIPNNLLNHFIRGLFDGDGCVTLSKHSNCNTNYLKVNYLSNKSLIENIRNLFNEKFCLNEVKICNYKYYSSIQYGSNTDVKKLYGYMYSNATVYLERKRNIFDEYFRDKCNL